MDYLEKENYTLSTDLEYRRGHIYSVILKEYKKYLVEPIMHVGCNSGSTTRLLSEYGETIGVDINENAILEARRRYPDLVFYVRNLLDLGAFANNTYGSVVAFDVLEHIFPNDLDRVIHELYRVLKFGGHCCIMVPTSNWCGAKDPSHTILFHCRTDIVIPLNKYFSIVECVHETRKHPVLDGQPDHWRVLCRKE